MKIAFETPPPESLTALEEGLAGLELAAPPPLNAVSDRFRKLAGDAPSQKSNMAHQVYALRLDRLAQGGPLEDAQLIGWRYIVDPTLDSIVSADVRVGDGGAYVFSEFGKNKIAGKTVAQLDKLSADQNFSQEKFIARLLSVFGLMFSALWLHRQGVNDFKNDIFIPLAGASSSLIAGRQYSGDALAAELHKKAAEQIKLVSDTSS